MPLAQRLRKLANQGKVIIAGTRDAPNADALVQAAIERAVAKGLPLPQVVVSGNSGTVDLAGEAWAQRQGVPVERYPADWQGKGQAAGPFRNRLMAMAAEALVAVWDGKSPGTRDMIEKARAAGLLVHVCLFGEAADPKVVYDPGQAPLRQPAGGLPPVAPVGPDRRREHPSACRCPGCACQACGAPVGSAHRPTCKVSKAKDRAAVEARLRDRAHRLHLLGPFAKQCAACGATGYLATDAQGAVRLFELAAPCQGGDSVLSLRKGAEERLVAAPYLPAADEGRHTFHAHDCAERGDQ